MKRKITIKTELEFDDIWFDVDLPERNPYEAESIQWHAFIDVGMSTNELYGTVSIATLMDEHDTPFGFYKSSLPQLIKDGYIKQIEGGLK